MSEIEIVQATAAPSGGAVAVRISGATGSVLVPTGFTMPGGAAIASGDVLLINKVRNRWWVTQGLYSAPLEAAPVTDAPPATVTSGYTLFTPTETRSYRPSGWRTDNTRVYQGEYSGQGLHRGCAFYGGGPTSLAGATVTAASVHVKRYSGGGFLGGTNGQTTLALYTESSRPAGAPTVQNTTTGPNLPQFNDALDFTVPTAWGQALVDGTAGALGLYDADGSPYVITVGNEVPWGWTLRIDWAR